MDFTYVLLLLGALGFGIAHAFEPDHMAAVSTFVASRPKPREAALFGVRWAVGHGLSLFLIGSVLFLLRRAAEHAQPQLFASGILDRIVGLVLVGLGVWTLQQVVFGPRHRARTRTGHFHDGHFHAHDDANAHNHSHGHGHSHASGWASLGMGVLHGSRRNRRLCRSGRRRAVEFLRLRLPLYADVFGRRSALDGHLRGRPGRTHHQVRAARHAGVNGRARRHGGFDLRHRLLFGRGHRTARIARTIFVHQA